MAHFLLYLHTMIAAAPTVTPGKDPNDLGGNVLTFVAGPMLTAGQYLIPAAVAISGIHKLMDHQSSGGAFLIEMVTKGGGAVLVLQLVKALAGIG